MNAQGTFDQSLHRKTIHESQRLTQLQNLDDLQVPQFRHSVTSLFVSLNSLQFLFNRFPIEFWILHNWKYSTGRQMNSL